MSLLLTVLKQACLLLIVALVVLLGTNVFMRYALGSPLSWSAELTELMLIWLSFLGLAVAAAERRHMAMDLLGRMLPAGAARALDGLISVVAIVTAAYIVISGIRLVDFNLGLNSEQLQISYAVFDAAVPVGFFCYLLFELRHLAGLVGGAQPTHAADPTH